MRFAVVGAGAIGGYLAIKLALAGEQMSVIARGANLAAIRAGGMKLIAEDGTEAAGIRRYAHLAHLCRQLVRSKLDRALNQVIRHQAGLQGGQHHQYRPKGKHRGKVAVLKKSLQDI